MDLYVEIISIPKQELIKILKTEIREIIKEELRTELDTNRKNSYNLEEAANYLNMSVATFRIHQHKIGGSKLGRRWIFKRRELDEYYNKNKLKLPYNDL